MAEQRRFALLGQLLLGAGDIEPEALREAVSKQKASGKPLRQVLLEMESIAPQQLERALRRQARLRGRSDQDRTFVLVVDDDAEVNALVGDVLEGAGYRVGLAQDEAEAFAALFSEDAMSPSAIVLDLGLPNDGGFRFLAALYKDETTRDIPVVILTGNPGLRPELDRRGLRVSEFLAKPVGTQQLVQTVEAALRQVPAQSKRSSS